MIPVTLSKGSNLYRLAFKYGKGITHGEFDCFTNQIDICTLTRLVLVGIFCAIMLVIFGALLGSLVVIPLAWLAVMVIMGTLVDPGPVPIALFMVGCMGAAFWAVVAFTMHRRVRRARARATDDHVNTLRIKRMFQAWKERFCVAVEIVK